MLIVTMAALVYTPMQRYIILTGVKSNGSFGEFLDTLFTNKAYLSSIMAFVDVILFGIFILESMHPVDESCETNGKELVSLAECNWVKYCYGSSLSLLFLGSILIGNCRMKYCRKCRIALNFMSRNNWIGRIYLSIFAPYKASDELGPRRRRRRRRRYWVYGWPIASTNQCCNRPIGCPCSTFVSILFRFYYI